MRSPDLVASIISVLRESWSLEDHSIHKIQSLRKFDQHCSDQEELKLRVKEAYVLLKKEKKRFGVSLLSAFLHLQKLIMYDVDVC